MRFSVRVSWFIGAGALTATAALMAACASAPVRPADELASLAAASAKDSALGRCPDSRTVDIGSVDDVVASPQHGAQRLDNGKRPMVDDTTTGLRLEGIGAPWSKYNFPDARHATAVAIIDTTGHAVTGSVVITKSDGMAITRGLCAVFPQLVFEPAMENGRKVRALYRETFAFFRPYRFIQSAGS